MTYVREHDLANAHPLKLAAEKKAERAVKALRKSHARKAEALQAKAQKLLDEASELSYLATRYNEYETPYATLRDKIEEAGYWAAREAIGILPRDADGKYVDPAPKWSVSLGGEFVGIFQGEERYDALRAVCPIDSTEHKWSDYTVERV